MTNWLNSFLKDLDNNEVSNNSKLRFLVTFYAVDTSAKVPFQYWIEDYPTKSKRRTLYAVVDAYSKQELKVVMKRYFSKIQFLQVTNVKDDFIPMSDVFNDFKSKTGLYFKKKKIITVQDRLDAI